MQRSDEGLALKELSDLLKNALRRIDQLASQQVVPSSIRTKNDSGSDQLSASTASPALACSIKEACRRVGVSRSHLYEAISE